MQRWLVFAACIVTALALVPLALIARARVVPKTAPRIHLVPDMDAQAKLKAQQANPMFADGRAMRPPAPGTVGRADEIGNPALTAGRTPAGEWVSAFPVPVTAATLARGKERYEVFCAPCHGLAGYGDGVVSKRGERLQEGTWTPASSLHTDLVRGRPVGQLFNTVANGVRTMPAYGPQLQVADRWAVVAYLRALQRSQHATVADVPAELRPQLR